MVSGRREADVQRAARFLKDAADYFQIKSEISGQNDQEGELLRKNAAAFKALSLELGPPAEELPDYSPASTLLWRNGPWLRRRKFFGKVPDRPAWTQAGAPGPELLWTGIDDTTDEWKALDELFEKNSWARDALTNVQIARPAFLPRVTLAHVERKGDIVWDALFSIVEESEDGKNKLRARSFDFESGEIHRLNGVTPVNTVGHELSYLRYFMGIIRADEGAFYLLEGQVWELVRPFLESYVKRAGTNQETIANIRAPRFSHVDAGGGLVYSVWILYGDDIFRAQLSVFPDGTMEMSDDEPFVSDVPGLYE